MNVTEFTHTANEIVNDYAETSSPVTHIKFETTLITVRNDTDTDVLDYLPAFFYEFYGINLELEGILIAQGEMCIGEWPSEVIDYLKNNS